jgi:hypothetical protein
MASRHTANGGVKKPRARGNEPRAVDSTGGNQRRDKRKAEGWEYGCGWPGCEMVSDDGRSDNIKNRHSNKNSKCPWKVPGQPTPKAKPLPHVVDIIRFQETARAYRQVNPVPNLLCTALASPSRLTPAPTPAANTAPAFAQVPTQEPIPTFPVVRLQQNWRCSIRQGPLQPQYGQVIAQVPPNNFPMQDDAQLLGLMVGSRTNFVGGNFDQDLWERSAPSIDYCWLDDVGFDSVPSVPAGDIAVSDDINTAWAGPDLPDDIVEDLLEPSLLTSHADLQQIGGQFASGNNALLDLNNISRNWDTLLDEFNARLLPEQEAPPAQENVDTGVHQELDFANVENLVDDADMAVFEPFTNFLPNGTAPNEDDTPDNEMSIEEYMNSID